MAQAIHHTGITYRNPGHTADGLAGVTRLVSLFAAAAFTLVCAGTFALALLSWTSGTGTAGFLGREVLTVRSGSMSPTFAAGDAVIIRHTSVDQVRALAVGDIVTIQPPTGNGMLVTHRIASITVGAHGHRVFTTKGDANAQVDPAPVDETEVVGLVSHAVPRLGFVLHALEQRRVLMMFGTSLLLGQLAVALVRIAGDQDTQTDNNNGGPQ